MRLPAFSDTAATMDSSAGGPAGSTDDGHGSSGTDAERTTVGVPPAKSFRDAEDPVDVFTRGCLAEYSDATCGTRTKVHTDRCYAHVTHQYDEILPRPSSREIIEVYTFDDEGDDCAKDECCPAFSETIKDCWQECQITGTPRRGYCNELPVCADNDAVQFGCEKVPCFGAQPPAAKCTCLDAPSSRDSDGFDPETRGCLTKYADAECGGATMYETDRCGVGLVHEVGARSTDLGQSLPSGECGTLDYEDFDCVALCKSKMHKSGTCEEADIACGAAMMKSGKCVCTD